MSRNRYFDVDDDESTNNEANEVKEVLVEDEDVFKEKPKKVEEKPLIEAFNVEQPKQEEPKLVKPKDLDESKYIWHPEDGSISTRVDENGCPRGTKWDEELGRCILV